MESIDHRHSFLRRLPGGDLRGGLDGSVPAGRSPAYEGPVTLDRDVQVRAALFDASGRMLEGPNCQSYSGRRMHVRYARFPMPPGGLVDVYLDDRLVFSRRPDPKPGSDALPGAPGVPGGVQPSTGRFFFKRRSQR